MSGVGGPGSVGGAMGIDRVMALRAEILERNAALKRTQDLVPAPGTDLAAPKPAASSFADTMAGALRDVNSAQANSSALSAAYERGETIDIAKVMMARQQASIGFEATLQVRNKLLSAYKDIMSMPV